MLRDSFGRGIDYLRLSVTDRCNLRCEYCLPSGPSAPKAFDGDLSDEEIVTLARRFAALGVRRLRITGGEPLVRPGLPGLVAALAGVRGISDISLSTNGVLLAGLAAELKAAGLSRVNISLDSLDSARFFKITRHGSLAKTLEGVEAALAVGLSPVKLNVVVARGMNEDEIPRFAQLTVDRPLHVRFIELMPMGETGFFSQARRVPLPEMIAAAGPVEPVTAERTPTGFGPARYFALPGSRGTIGFISALSCGFCDTCNRLRLSCTGRLYPCLDGEQSVDLRGPLRAGAGAAELDDLIAAAVREKPAGHDMEARAVSVPNSRFMCQLGG